MNQQTNPELTGRLAQLVDLAKQAGAEGVIILRGATDARLEYSPPNPPVPPQVQGWAADMALLGMHVDFSQTVTSTLAIADCGVLVLIRLPAGDGGAPGIEVR